MTQAISRRSFVAASAVLGLGAGARAGEVGSTTAAPEDPFPHHPAELAQAIVGASHTNLPKVKELVERCPPLARAAWDWGFGDWETALGAASHTGRRDIAEYLMSHGARPDIFTFAMLGNLEAVKGMIAGQPGVQRVAGPHGITLLQHAKNGGGDAAKVAEYLEGLGDAGNAPKDQPMTAEEIQVYLGNYRLEGRDSVRFVIKDVKGKLAFQRGEESHRFLINHSGHVFTPAGSPEVRLVFEVRDGRATAIVGTRHDSDFKAIRVE